MSTREDDVVAGFAGNKRTWGAFLESAEPVLTLGEVVGEVVALNEAIITLKDRLPSAIKTHPSADLKRFLFEKYPALSKSAEISYGVDAKNWGLFLSMLLPQVVGVKSSAFGSPAEAVDFFSTIPLILSRSHNIAHLTADGTAEADDTAEAAEDKQIADALKDVVKRCGRLIVIAQDYLNKELNREAGIDSSIDATVKSPKDYILASMEAFRRIQGLGNNLEGILSAASYRFVAVPALKNFKRHIVDPYTPRPFSKMMGSLVIPAHQWASIAGGSAHLALAGWQGLKLARLVGEYPEAASIFSAPAQTISHVGDKMLALMPPSMPWPEDSLPHRKALYHLLNDELLGKGGKDSILESALKNLIYNLSLEGIHKVSREVSPKLVKILASLLILNRLEDGMTFLGANAAFDLLLSNVFAAPLVMTAQMLARPALSGKIDSAIVRGTLRFEIRKLLVAYLFNPEELLFFEALTPPSLTEEEEKQVKHFIEEINGNLSHAQTLYKHRAKVAHAVEFAEGAVENLARKAFTYVNERLLGQKKPLEEKAAEAPQQPPPRKNQAPAFIRTPYTAYQEADKALKQTLFGAHAGIYPTGSDSKASKPIGRFIDRTLKMVPYAGVRQVPSPWEVTFGRATVLAGVAGMGYGSYAIGQRVAGVVGGYVGIGVYSAAGIATATYFGIFESQAQKLLRQMNAAKATYQLPSEAEIKQAERDFSKSPYACCFRPINLTGSRRARFAELEGKAKSALDTARGLARETVDAQSGINAAKTEKALTDLNVASLVERIQAHIKKDADYPEVDKATRLLMPICYQLEQNFKKHEKTLIDNYGHQAFIALFSTLGEMAMDSEDAKDLITAFWRQKIEDPRLKEDYPTLHTKLTVELESLKTSWGAPDARLLNWLESRKELFQAYIAFKEEFAPLIIEHAYDQAWLQKQTKICQDFKETLTEREFKDSRLTQGFDNLLIRAIESVQQRFAEQEKMTISFKKEIASFMKILSSIQASKEFGALPDAESIAKSVADFKQFSEENSENAGKQDCIREALGSPPKAATGTSATAEAATGTSATAEAATGASATAEAATGAAPRRSEAEDNAAIYLKKIKRALKSRLSAFKYALLATAREKIDEKTASLKNIKALSEAFESEVAAYATRLGESVVSEAVTGHIDRLRKDLSRGLIKLHRRYDATDEVRDVYKPIETLLTTIKNADHPSTVLSSHVIAVLPTQETLTSETKCVIDALTPFAEYHLDELKAIVGAEGFQEIIHLRIQTSLKTQFTAWLNRDLAQSVEALNKDGTIALDVLTKKYQPYITSLKDTPWQASLQVLLDDKNKALDTAVAKRREEAAREQEEAARRKREDEIRQRQALKLAIETRAETAMRTLDSQDNIAGILALRQYALDPDKKVDALPDTRENAELKTFLKEKQAILNNAIKEKLGEHDPGTEFQEALSPIKALMSEIERADHLPSEAGGVAGVALPGVTAIKGAFEALDTEVSTKFAHVNSAQYQAVLTEEFGIIAKDEALCAENVARLKARIQTVLAEKLTQLMQATLARKVQLVLAGASNPSQIKEGLNSLEMDTKKWESRYQNALEAYFGNVLDLSNPYFQAVRHIRDSRINNLIKKDILEFFSTLETQTNSRTWSPALFSSRPHAPLTKQGYDEAVAAKKGSLGAVAKFYFIQFQRVFEESHPEVAETPAAESTPAAAAAASSRG